MYDNFIERKWHKKRTNELDFMKSLWAKLFGSLDAVGQCEECGRSILFNPMHMAHINSKGARPDLRTTEDNILVLCYDHHTQMDAQFEGKTRRDLRVFPKIEEIILKYKSR